MIGSIRWNLVLGIFGFFLTFILSILNNIFSTAFINGLYSGMILFLVAFIVRWFFATIFQTASIENQIGNKFDLITPDESDEIHQLLRNESGTEIEQSQFVPLNPPKLVSKRNVEPEEMVKALRQLSED
jgi:predicted PurR-regulated permease PerM